MVNNGDASIAKARITFMETDRTKGSTSICNRWKMRKESGTNQQISVLFDVYYDFILIWKSLLIRAHYTLIGEFEEYIIPRLIPA
ncbi:MAG TPA: hypothetical protein PLB62_00385, partial [Candidatus Sumerlaeota bacterium]|nr:hypothetical protein [Candidatus Sumerlaeota bacterium]